MSPGISRSGWSLQRLAVDKLGWHRDFSPASSRRLLLLSVRNRIAHAQIFPFLYYRKEIARRHGLEIREVPLETFLTSPPRYRKSPDAVCFQTGFDLDPEAMNRLVASLRASFPSARFAYLDWFAPTDLRYAATLDPHVSMYVKKHVLRDRSLYRRSTLGDTNLTDHFARRFGIDYPERRFEIPEGFFSKLHLGTNFSFSAPLLSFFRRGFPARRDRPIDVHARITTDGDPWYSEMRREALAKVEELKNTVTITRGRVSNRVFLKELFRSKICFSPFGYGEVCWRDYEAILAGSLLLKQDTSHVETRPDVFVANEAYVPVAWDLSDLEEKCADHLRREDLRERIARRAFDVVSDYIRQDRFLEESTPLFQALLDG